MTVERPSKMMQWLTESGAPQQKVKLQTVVREGTEVDITVAAEALQPGDVALRIPEHLIVTLDRVLEDNTLAELVTTGKLSELACLTLYLAYEKKRGKEGCWYRFIKELDRMQGRGSQGAKSPLLWDEGQAAELLAGSPVVGEIEARLQGIRKEYEELDTVWYLAGSLFNRQPFSPPTEQFSFPVFRQAFTAVQSSVVHLQGVALGKRFALVPMGPPLLTYSSTAKAMLKFDPESHEVRLAVDRAYQPGEAVLAWCGPQPNSRLLINYGIVDESNPYDKLPLSITIPSDDPLYRLKRDRLAERGLSTQQTFQLQAAASLPAQLLPYLRLVHSTREADVEGVKWEEEAGPVAPENELTVLNQLITHLRLRQSRYRTTIEEDEAIIADPAKGPRPTVAARLLKIEKGILAAAVAAAMALPGAAEAAAHGPVVTAIKME
ncbi:hypothetical protein CHLNCDRAFT_57818 [Chlorella variabilis]|uniref:Rubisco LSMT substrate-binding domain-containing protein n=1 Tax=Chlorella variabilis TaxID=554065 RepID=E1ZF87_CHLVA|nr:hypothetical protein CHLNCDRAFT_57818 [Chlorella variabilis]EFN55628.1 hypothetical protein CHLNCDRAFT_57818 [Chlorella variabilis]|eukprot:XP_005847730.1 hypothetical protein CHLNCDRAFT_57818 [Chlorella variabilis]